MPLHLILGFVENGLPEPISRNMGRIILTIASIAFLTLLKMYMNGRMSPAMEKPMHGKVAILTGGTSGIGAEVAKQLAKRGTQLCLLTQTPASDPFLVEYIQDLRESTNNQLIYAEQVDLTSFHDIRKFATKWIDNAPPRRLDMIILCASTLTLPGGKRKENEEGIEETWMVNFLANFHLLSILSPALRAQPFDRDVRVIIPTCSSYIGSPPFREPMTKSNWTPGRAYARSKLALNVFGQAFQKHLDAYKRPDGLPMNTRVIFVDPGLARTPSTRRWLTRGSLVGLAFYLVGYVLPWFFIKSPYMAAQSILFAVMDGGLGRGPGGRLIKECMDVDFARGEVKDDEVAKKLWEETDKLIEKVEKAQAKKRALQKGQDDEKKKQEELEALAEAIKKGKEKEKAKKEQQKGTAGKQKKKGKSVAS